MGVKFRTEEAREEFIRELHQPARLVRSPDMVREPEPIRATDEVGDEQLASEDSETGQLE